jgi:hypothetical protein
MERYYNATTKEWYNEGQSMTKRVENSVFTGIPTKQQLTEWGYTEVAPPEPYTPTEEDIKRQRMDEIRQQLSDTDYIIIKKAEGIDISEYNERYEGDFLAWRQRLRNEYNQLEDTL